MRKLAGKADVLFDRDEGLKIAIEDSLSGITITAVIPPMEAIAALSRQVHVNCEITYPSKYNLSLIGKKFESKIVFINKSWDSFRPTADQVFTQCDLEGLFVDGWALWQNGLSTQQDKRGKHRVVLERYVEL